MIGARRWGRHNHRCTHFLPSLSCAVFLLFFFFLWLATCQVEKKKNQPQQKKHFNGDLPASALKAWLVLRVYLPTNVPIAPFFADPPAANLLLASVWHRIQTMATDPGAYGPPAPLAVHMSKEVPHSAPSSVRWPRGQRRAGLRPWGVKGRSHRQ